MTPLTTKQEINVNKIIVHQYNNSNMTSEGSNIYSINLSQYTSADTYKLDVIVNMFTRTSTYANANCTLYGTKMVSSDSNQNNDYIACGDTSTRTNTISEKVICSSSYMNSMRVKMEIYPLSKEAYYDYSISVNGGNNSGNGMISFATLTYLKFLRPNSRW